MFDPLEYLEPGGVRKIDHEYSISEKILADDFDHEPESALHILDLPSVYGKPPACVMKLVLRLLATKERYNFEEAGSSVHENVASQAELSECHDWLSDKVRANIGQVGLLALADGFFNYVTLVVTCDLAWMELEDREAIWKLASLRLAENCGRMAQPEFIRRIGFEGSELSVRLKEPALTADNLGLKTWGSSLILSEKLIHSPQYLKKPILELGAGTGLVGITCGLLDQQGQLEGEGIYVTDLPEIVGNLKDNVELNGLSGVVEVACLDWREPQGFNHAEFRTVIFSDPIYSSEHPQLVIDMTHRFLAKSWDSRLLIEIPVREHFELERQELWKKIEAAGLKLVDSDQKEGLDDFGNSVHLFRLYMWR